MNTEEQLRENCKSGRLVNVLPNTLLALLDVVHAARFVQAQAEAIALSKEAPVIQDWGRFDRMGKALKAYEDGIQ